MNFEQYTATVNNETITFTVDQQKEAFEQFISNSPYLRDNRGKFAERNSALLPWYNRWDLRFLQDFYLITGKNQTRHMLQFSVDILNFSNLLNKNWGLRDITITNNPLVFRSINNTNENRPLYRLQNINGELVTDPFDDALSTTSTWSMQLGLRYTF